MDAKTILDRLKYSNLPHGFDLFPSLFKAKLYDFNGFDKISILFNLEVLILGEGKQLKDHKEEGKLLRSLLNTSVGTKVEDNFKAMSSIKKMIEHLYSKLSENGESFDVAAKFDECSLLFSRPAFQPTYKDLERFHQGWNLFRHQEIIYHREKDFLRKIEFNNLFNDSGECDFERLVRYYRTYHRILFNESIKILLKCNIRYTKLNIESKSTSELLDEKSKIVQNSLTVSDFDLDDICDIIEFIGLSVHERSKRTLNDQKSLVEILRKQLLIIRHIMDKLSIEKQFSVIEYMTEREAITSSELKLIKVQINLNYLVFRLMSRRVIITNLLFGFLCKVPLLIEFYFENSTLLCNYNKQFRIFVSSRDFLPQTQQAAIDYIIDEEIYTPNPHDFLDELGEDQKHLAKAYIKYVLTLDHTIPNLTTKLLKKMPELSCDEITLPIYRPKENNNMYCY